MLSYDQAEKAVATLEAWLDRAVSEAEMLTALRTLDTAIASGVQENVGRFQAALKRKTSRAPGMSREDMLRRAVSGMRMGIEVFRNAGREGL